ncbi:MAG: hypothetical protein Fur0034_11710 [Desulfuromonadia bacterium]
MSSFLTQPKETTPDLLSWRFFETLLDQFIDAAILYDEKEQVVLANRAAGELFRTSAGRLVGKGVGELIQCNMDETLLRDDELRHLFGVDKSWRLDCVASCFDGTVRPLSLTISSLSVADRRFGCMVMREITQWVSLFFRIREDEKAFHALFENYRDALLILSFPEGNVKLMNKRAEEIFGRGRGELLGAPQPFFPRDDFALLLQTAERGGDCLEPPRVTARRGDGSTFPASVDVKRISLRGEDVVYGTVRDLTETLRLEEEARTIQAELIYANKMSSLGLLVAGVAHEVNNPANYILANAELLKRVATDLDRCLAALSGNGDSLLLGGLPVDEVRSSFPGMVDAIISGAERIHAIVSGLKEYSRKGRESRGSHDLDDIIDNALLLVRHRISSFTDFFHYQRHPHPIKIFCSAQQIEQVLINILLNALESLPSRDRGVTLSAVVDAKRQNAVMTVVDEGVGIPPDHQERIFEPFFTTRLDRGGTGLGLSISRSIVRQHGGTIQIESEPGRGTTVTVTLPLNDVNQKGEMSQ